ncbi:hypothetical protein JCM12298_16650 [Desulfothermus naphthae]
MSLSKDSENKRVDPRIWGRELLRRYPEGIALNREDMLTLFLMYEYVKGRVTPLTWDKMERLAAEALNITEQKDKRPSSILERLLRRGFLLVNDSERYYYLSSLASAIAKNLVQEDLKHQSDIESHLYTLYVTLSKLGAEEHEKLTDFLKHTFNDLASSIINKIVKIREQGARLKEKVRQAVKQGEEEGLNIFLQELKGLQSTIAEMTEVLGPYSSYNTILNELLQWERYSVEHKMAYMDEMVCSAIESLRLLKEQIEEVALDLTEFVNRTTAITARINLRHLDRLIEMQGKILTWFPLKPFCLRKTLLPPQKNIEIPKRRKLRPTVLPEISPPTELQGDEFVALLQRGRELTSLFKKELEKNNKIYLICFLNKTLLPKEMEKYPFFYHCLIYFLAEENLFPFLEGYREIRGTLYSDCVYVKGNK